MFGYAPTENNESGRIMGGGIVNSANTNAQAKVKLVDDIGGAITTLAGAYAAGEATKAKGKAYGDFMSRHGEQLGFDPQYLQDFLKKKPAEQAMIGDSIVGMQTAGRNLMSLNYLNQQADRYPRTGGGGGGTGVGGGGMLYDFGD